jgi:hypothetical protein
MDVLYGGYPLLIQPFQLDIHIKIKSFVLSFLFHALSPILLP